jgi:hypothetical protein
MFCSVAAMSGMGPRPALYALPSCGHCDDAEQSDARLCQIERGSAIGTRPTCAHSTPRYAATLSRPCDVLASLPVTSSNGGPDPRVFVGELAFDGVSKPIFAEGFWTCTPRWLSRTT